MQDMAHEPSLGNAAALVPYGSLLRKAKALRGINVYHASPTPLKDLRHDPDKLFQGEGLATEGPGLYLTQHPSQSLLYLGQNAQINKAGDEGTSFLHRYHLPDEEFARYVKPYDLASTHTDTMRALQKMYPGKTTHEMQTILNHESPDSLLGLEKIDPHGANPQPQLRAMLERLRAAGVPGVQTQPGKGAYLVSHFPERLQPRGGPKPITMKTEDADWLAEGGADWSHGDDFATAAELAKGTQIYRKLRRGKSLAEDSHYVHVPEIVMHLPESSIQKWVQLHGKDSVTSRQFLQWQNYKLGHVDKYDPEMQGMAKYDPEKFKKYMEVLAGKFSD